MERGRPARVGKNSPAGGSLEGSFALSSVARGSVRLASGHGARGLKAGRRYAITAMEKSDRHSPDGKSPDASVKESSWKTEVLLAGSWRGATSTLLSRDHHHIIVDTGMPHEAHRLLDALEQRGLHPSDIHMVINTHFHVDHVLNNCLFPESDIYGSQQSYEWCCQAYADLLDEQNWEKLSLKYYPESADYERTPELMGALRRFALRWWDRKRLGDPSRFRWIETHTLPDDLEFLVTNGHVPGHTSVIVHHGDQPIIIAGDALLTREHDENVFTMIPHNRQQFQHDREHILARMGRIVPGHDDEFSNPNGKAPTPL
jgi:glyoxylase-like metal-dependent hydrolase (beta-lactamase superfamily II)